MTTEFFVHGLTLTLAWFVATNAVVSALIAGAASIVERRNRMSSARFWMWLRLGPALVAAFFVVALFVPSYWRYEPRESVEGFDLSLTILAAIALLILLAAACRGIVSWLKARRRVNLWMAHARPMQTTAGALPAFLVGVDQPMLALVGVLRPKLLITRGLLDALTPAELEAAVAHEIGHQRSFDNLKRLVMAAAPDCLTYFHTARRIERRWAAAAEHSADRISGPNVAAARCALASALVKVARLTPATIDHAEPISALISGGEIAARVQRLLSDDDGVPPARAWTARVGLGIACALISVVTYGPLLRLIHELTEVLVRSLP